MSLSEFPVMDVEQPLVVASADPPAVSLEADRLRFFDVYRVPVDDSARRAFAALHTEAARRAKPPKEPRADAARVLAVALERILANLLYWPSVGAEWFALPADKNAYPRSGPYMVPVDDRAVRRARSLLEHAGLIEIIKGAKVGEVCFSDNGEMAIATESRVTVARATPALHALFAEHGLTGQGSTIKTQGIQLVLLKASKQWWSPRAELMSYDNDSPLARADRKRTARINKRIAATPMAYLGSANVDINNRWLCRHYTCGEVHGMKLRLGGRLFGERGYNPWWYPLEHSDRITNTRLGVSQERCVGLDFSNAFARLAYAGTKPPEGDLYAIPWVTEAATQDERKARRKCVKALFASLMFRKARPKKWPGDAKGEPIEHPEGAPLNVILDQIEAKHPALVEGGRLYSMDGHKLMYLESQIAQRALLTLDEANITALPVHDCLVVAQSHCEAAEAAMREAWAYHTQGHVACVIEAEYPTDHVPKQTPDMAHAWDF